MTDKSWVIMDARSVMTDTTLELGRDRHELGHDTQESGNDGPKFEIQTIVGTNTHKYVNDKHEFKMTNTS